MRPLIMEPVRSVIATVIREAIGESILIPPAVLPDPITRFFTPLDSSVSQYLEFSQHHNLTGDFKIPFELYPDDFAEDVAILGDSNGSALDYIAVIATTGHVRFRVGAVDYDYTTIPLQVTKFNSGVLERVGSVTTLTMNDSSENITTGTADFTFNLIASAGNGFFPNGIPANIKVSGDGIDPIIQKLDENFGVTNIGVNSAPGALGSELWDDNAVTYTGTGWVNNGDGTFTHSGSVSGELRIGGAPLVENNTYLCEGELLSGSGSIKLGGPGTNSIGVGDLPALLTAEGTGAINAIRVISSTDGTIVRINSVKPAYAFVTAQNISTDSPLFTEQVDGNWLGVELWTLGDIAYNNEGQLQNLAVEDILTSGDVYQGSAKAINLTSGIYDLKAGGSTVLARCDTDGILVTGSGTSTGNNAIVRSFTPPPNIGSSLINITIKQLLEVAS